MLKAYRNAASRPLYCFRVLLGNHVLRSRGGFMKIARRKLHRTFKYRSEEKFTFQRWLNRLLRLPCLRTLLGTCPEEPYCLLCGTTRYFPNSNTELIRCKSLNCPGIYCTCCFSDIGELCTICMSPKDYGDFSDVSLEKGSSDESDYDEGSLNRFSRKSVDNFRSSRTRHHKIKQFSKQNENGEESISLLSESHQ